ncbi:MAG: fumarate hydratase, partial [Clostridiales bacterium]|nr:fumarate hydratase [Clostridiales bacterium]
EKAALLAKYALARKLGRPHAEPEVAALEAALLTEINALGIGAQGFGGTVTALAVHVETFACHLASLPVAVNLNCFAARHKSVVI